MKSIALICNEYPPFPHGGIGTFVQILGRALVQRGYRVRVAGSYPARMNFAEREDDHGVEVWRLREPEKDRGGVLARYALYRLVADWAQRGELDLIELPDPQGWGAMWPSLKVPVVTRVHGSSSYFARELGRARTFQTALSFWLEKRQMRRSDFWCSVSRYAADQTAAMFGLRPADAISFVPVSIPAPVPFSSRLPERVIFTGTLTPKKGILSLMRAWPRIRSLCPRAELHVFGKGDPSMQCALVRDLDAQSRASVQFYGHTARQDVYKQLQTARVAVFPSYAEAFAFAPLEAMASGCPTVYSTRTSGAEAIDHGRDGLLIDPDNIEQLSDAVSDLLMDNDLAFRIGHCGRVRVEENFTVDRVVGNIETFYRSCSIRFRKSALVNRTAA